MSLQAIRILTRSLSANLRRHVTSVPRSQSSVSNASRRLVSNTPKNTETEEEPVLPPRSAVKRKKSAPKIKAVEKGDTYTAGEAYYSFDPYTFYDVEEKLLASRQPQISSSEKMKIFCMDKLNIADDEPPRRLLPEEYGYMVEWPGKTKPKTKYKPMYSVMEKTYGLDYDSKTGEICRDRIPL